MLLKGKTRTGGGGGGAAVLSLSASLKRLRKAKHQARGGVGGGGGGGGGGVGGGPLGGGGGRERGGGGGGGGGGGCCSVPFSKSKSERGHRVPVADTPRPLPVHTASKQLSRLLLDLFITLHQAAPQPTSTSQLEEIASLLHRPPGTPSGGLRIAAPCCCPAEI